MEGRTPAWRQRFPKAIEIYCPSAANSAWMRGAP
jgi:hypothetical protein